MAKQRVVGIVQARMGSTRLSAKVLKSLRGKPMLVRQLERLKQAAMLDSLIVATTDCAEDTAIAELAKSVGVQAFRGSEKDVLDRYYKAAQEMNADVVVRVTGDCPLHDAEVIHTVIKRFQERHVEYTKTPENFPEGLDTEVFSFSTLETAWRNAKLPSEREHVTPYIRNHPELFKLDEKWTEGTFDYSTYHWSVDTEADFKFVEKVYENFGEREFHMRDVIELLQEQPEFLQINKGGTGYEGLAKSQQEDAEWQKHHG